MLRGYIAKLAVHAAIAQLVERIHGKDEVSGSSPDRGSIIAFRNICFTSQLRLFEAGVFY